MCCGCEAACGLYTAVCGRKVAGAPLCNCPCKVVYTILLAIGIVPILVAVQLQR